jgi:hypothetical protein
MGAGLPWWSPSGRVANQGANGAAAAGVPRVRAPTAWALRVSRTINAWPRKQARNLNAAHCPDGRSGGMNNPGPWAGRRFLAYFSGRGFPSGVPSPLFGKDEHG